MPYSKLYRNRIGRNISIFIKYEFNKNLRCGIAEFGFVRTYCYQCRASGIVAFFTKLPVKIKYSDGFQILGYYACTTKKGPFREADYIFLQTWFIIVSHADG